MKEWLELRRIGQFKLMLAQSSILMSCNHKTQGWISLLGLVPFIYGHASDLCTVPYCVQDAQIATIHFNGACGALKDGFLHSSYCCCSDLKVVV